jgi:hypothetical protein
MVAARLCLPRLCWRCRAAAISPPLTAGRCDCCDCCDCCRSCCACCAAWRTCCSSPCTATIATPTPSPCGGGGEVCSGWVAHPRPTSAVESEADRGRCCCSCRRDRGRRCRRRRDGLSRSARCAIAAECGLARQRCCWNPSKPSFSSCPFASSSAAFVARLPAVVVPWLDRCGSRHACLAPLGWSRLCAAPLGGEGGADWGRTLGPPETKALLCCPAGGRSSCGGRLCPDDDDDDDDDADTWASLVCREVLGELALRRMTQPPPVSLVPVMVARPDGLCCCVCRVWRAIHVWRAQLQRLARPCPAVASAPCCCFCCTDAFPRYVPSALRPSPRAPAAEDRPWEPPQAESVWCCTSAQIC